MVARISRLRIALLLSPIKRPIRDSLLALLSRLIMLSIAVGLAWLPTFIAGGDLALLHEVDVVVAGATFATVVLVYFFIPSLVLNPRSFGPYPVTPTRVAVSLVITSPISWVGVGMIAWAVSFVIFRRDLVDWNAIGIVGVILVIASSLVATRLAALLSSFVFEQDRLARIRGSLGILATVASLPIVGLLVLPAFQTEGQEELHEAFSLLRWIPAGGATDAIHLASINVGTASAILLMLVAVIAMILGGVVSLTIVLMERVPPQPVSMSMNTSNGWFGYLPMTPVLSIGARSLTYWARDPRYRVSLAAIPMIPIIVVGVLWFVGVDPSILAMIPLPLILIMLGWLVHNDIATDSTALWLHVASGIPGRQDRIGRLIPVFIVGIPLLMLGTSITVSVLGDWRTFPVIISIGLVALSASSALSSIVSVVHPYPTSRPGESPFVQPAWQGIGSGLAQSVTFIGSVVLVLPVIFAGFTNGFNISAGHGMVTLLTSICYAAFLLVGGVLLGGWVYDRKASELLAFTQMYD